MGYKQPRDSGSTILSPVPLGLLARVRGLNHLASDQNSEQFITTRPRQISLRQTTLHFS
jgi:hypothetical protein